MKLWILTLLASACRDVKLQALRKMLLWDIGVATSQKKGKPPPESKSKIDRCNLHMHVETKVGCKNTILFTDGAPAYPSVAERLQIQHEWVNHSKGQFTKTVTRQARGRPIVVAHTGTIDSCWKQCKKDDSKQFVQSPSDAPDLLQSLAVALCASEWQRCTDNS